MLRVDAGEHVIGTEGGRTTPVAGLPPDRIRNEAFEIDVAEVTVKDYAACVAAKSCDTALLEVDPLCNWVKPDREGHPINCVSFLQAGAYCRWENRRLPSEVEWEIAASLALSAATALAYERVTGAGQICLTAELSSYPSLRQRDERPLGTCPIGAPTPKAKLALADMLGNVSEWTVRATMVRPGNDENVLRGTAWLGDLYESFRHRWYEPGPGGLAAGRRIPPQIGFRCARSVEPP